MTEPTKAPPAPPPKTTSPVPVRAPDGTIGTVPADQLEQAVDAGAQVVSQDELHAAQQAVKYGSAVNATKAFGAGVARGATLGLSDVAATELAPEEAEQFATGASENSTRAELAGLKEANPYASGAGELAGAIAPMVVSGGVAAPVEGAELAGEGLSLGRAVRGLGALPRGVGALGELAERGAGYVAGEGVLGRAVAGGARGAVEGAIYNEGNQVSDAALGDHELTAEKLLSGAREGALLGGAGGALLGGAGGYMGHGPAARDVEAVASRATGEEAAPGLGELVLGQNRTDAAAEKYIQQVAESPDQAKLLSEAWRRRAEVFGKHEETLENATRKVTENLDTAVKAERSVDLAAFGEAKENQMAKLVDPSRWREARETALNVWQDATNTVQELMADPTRGGAGVAVNRAAKWLEKFGTEIGDAATSKSKEEVASKLFSRLDDFKRAMADGAQFGRGPFGLPEAAREFDGLYHRIRDALENEQVWGHAGAAQKEINAAAQARFATRRQFGATFTTQYGSEAGRPLYVANPEGAASYVRNLTSAKNDLKHRALTDYIDNEERFLDAVGKHYELPPEKRADIARAREAFKSLRATVDDTAKEVSTVNQLRRLQAEEQAHGLGGMVGLAADVASRPLKTLERLARIEQHARRIDGALTKGIKVFFGRGGEGAAGGGAAAAVKPLREEYAAKASEVSRLASNPDMATQRIAGALESLHQVAPRVALSVAAKSSATAAFLASKLPRGFIDPDSLTPHLDEPRVSDADMDRFLRYARGTDARAVAEDLAAGRLSRESVEAFQTTAPKLYAQLTAGVQQHLTTLKEPLPYQKELQLRILLGQPAAAPDFLRELQKTFADHGKDNEAAPEKSSSPVPLKISVDQRSESERVEGM